MWCKPVILLMCFLIVTSHCEAPPDEESILSRKRRAATQFYHAIQCYQPDALVLKLYGDYGCHCGVGGVGDRALDATDRCCQVHDACYTEVKKNSSGTYYERGIIAICGHLCVSYTHSCVDGGVKCGSDNSDLARGICECDREASKCFAESRSSYDRRLGNVNPEVWCTETSNVTELLSKVKLANHVTTVRTAETTAPATVGESFPSAKTTKVTKLTSKSMLLNDLSTRTTSETVTPTSSASFSVRISDDIASSRTTELTSNIMKNSVDTDMTSNVITTTDTSSAMKNTESYLLLSGLSALNTAEYGFITSIAAFMENLFTTPENPVVTSENDVTSGSKKVVTSTTIGKEEKDFWIFLDPNIQEMRPVESNRYFPVFNESASYLLEDNGNSTAEDTDIWNLGIFMKFVENKNSTNKASLPFTNAFFYLLWLLIITLNTSL